MLSDESFRLSCSIDLAEHSQIFMQTWQFAHKYHALIHRAVFFRPNIFSHVEKLLYLRRNRILLPELAQLAL